MSRLRALSNHFAHGRIQRPSEAAPALAARFAESLLEFWFESDEHQNWHRETAPVPEVVESRWWGGGEELDRQIADRFGAQLLAAASLLEAATPAVPASAAEEEGWSAPQRLLAQSAERMRSASVPAVAWSAGGSRSDGDGGGEASATSSAARDAAELLAPILQVSAKHASQSPTSVHTRNTGQVPLSSIAACLCHRRDGDQPLSVAEARGVLALVICLDQFSRNVLRSG